MRDMAQESSWLENNGIPQELFIDPERERIVGSCQFATGATLYGALMHERGVAIDAHSAASEFMDLLRSVDQYPLWVNEAPRIPFASIAMALAKVPGLQVIYSHENASDAISSSKVNQAIADNNLLLAWGHSAEMNLLASPDRYPGVQIERRQQSNSTWDSIKQRISIGAYAIFMVDNGKFSRGATSKLIPENMLGASGIHTIGGLALDGSRQRMLTYDSDGGYSYEGEVNPSTGTAKSRVNWIDLNHLQESVLPDQPVTYVRNVSSSVDMV